jgi:hypothetical protein
MIEPGGIGLFRKIHRGRAQRAPLASILLLLRLGRFLEFTPMGETSKNSPSAARCSTHGGEATLLWCSDQDVIEKYAASPMRIRRVRDAHVTEWRDESGFDTGTGRQAVDRYIERMRKLLRVDRHGYV